MKMDNVSKITSTNTYRIECKIEQWESAPVFRDFIVEDCHSSAEAVLKCFADCPFTHRVDILRVSEVY